MTVGRLAVLEQVFAAEQKLRDAHGIELQALREELEGKLQSASKELLTVQEQLETQSAEVVSARESISTIKSQLVKTESDLEAEQKVRYVMSLFTSFED